MSNIYSNVDMCLPKQIARVTMVDEVVNKQNDWTGYYFNHGLGMHSIKPGERVPGKEVRRKRYISR